MPRRTPSSRSLSTNALATGRPPALRQAGRRLRAIVSAPILCSSCRFQWHILQHASAAVGRRARRGNKRGDFGRAHALQPGRVGCGSGRNRSLHRNVGHARALFERITPRRHSMRNHTTRVARGCWRRRNCEGRRRHASPPMKSAGGPPSCGRARPSVPPTAIAAVEPRPAAAGTAGLIQDGTAVGGGEPGWGAGPPL